MRASCPLPREPRHVDAPPILILDDGELDDVAETLERLGESYVRLRGGAIPEPVPTPTRLLVATARRAHLACDPEHTPGAPRAVRLAVVSEDSNTLRSRLRRLGFDWLIRRPVHPHALRLVLLRALYEGRERRARERLPAGTAVHVRSGLRRRDAVMLDLSSGGCRLLLTNRPTAGARIAVHVPGEACGGRGMTLRARIVRTQCLDDGTWSAGVTFERLSRDAEARLQRMLKERARGPDALPRAGRPLPGAEPVSPGARAAASPASPAPDAPLQASAAERRKHPRVAYRQLVRGEADEAHLALVGRDLSAGGMRIAPHPGLREGDRLVLHLYGDSHEEPVPVRGRVARDQGTDGLAIRFDALPRAVAARIEAMVAGLPAVESLAGGESDALGSIVSQIVERESAGDEEIDAVDERADAGAEAGGPGGDAPDTPDDDGLPSA